MKISSELFFYLLSERFPAERIRGKSNCASLSLPMFYMRGTEPVQGRLYVCSSQNLPDSADVDCVFVCVGNRPAAPRGRWKSELIYIQERGIDVRSLFNFLVETFDRLSTWSERLRTLEDIQGSIDEFVKCSYPIFNNAITITDYNLRILSNSEYIISRAGREEVPASSRYKHIPNEISIGFQPEFMNYVQMRKPYFYKGQENNPEGNNYCVNMFCGDSYIGTCTLWDALHPIRGSDMLMFQYFASQIQKALSKQTELPAYQVITLKSIFTNLLQGYPVSIESMREALDLAYKNLEFRSLSPGCWSCLVIKSANSKKTLPRDYLCSIIENMLPHTTVIDFDGVIVCFCIIPEGENCEDTILNILYPYLKDMNFRAGVSYDFIDLLRAQDYYLQAKAMLETGCKLAPQELIYRFDDYILPYMMGHSVGEFNYNLIESLHLKALKTIGSKVDYWGTLRHYLDNECNSTKTAEELYLHRSSLMLRIEKIRSVVKMDTPEQRLYLRICMYLDELKEREFEAKRSD